MEPFEEGAVSAHGWDPVGEAPQNRSLIIQGPGGLVAVVSGLCVLASDSLYAMVLRQSVKFCKLREVGKPGPTGRRASARYGVYVGLRVL